MEDMYFVLKRARIPFLVFTDETGPYLFIKWCINCAFQREKAPEATHLLKDLKNSSMISKGHIKWIKRGSKIRLKSSLAVTRVCVRSVLIIRFPNRPVFLSSHNTLKQKFPKQKQISRTRTKQMQNLNPIRFSVLCESIRWVLEKTV